MEGKLSEVKIIDRQIELQREMLMMSLNDDDE